MLSVILNFSASLVPLLVVTIITPFDPLEPYKAAPLEPFITLTDSIISGFNSAKAPDVEITPLITISASLSPVIDLNPRSCILVSGLTPLLTVLICKPDTFPTKPTAAFVAFA